MTMLTWCYCRFLTYNPSRRVTAEEACRYEFFTESPLPVDPSMFPTWPAKSEQSRATRSHGNSPKPPSGGKAYAKLLVSFLVPVFFLIQRLMFLVLQLFFLSYCRPSHLAILWYWSVCPHALTRDVKSLIICRTPTAALENLELRTPITARKTSTPIPSLGLSCGILYVYLRTTWEKSFIIKLHNSVQGNKVEDTLEVAWWSGIVVSALALINNVNRH